jgi:hypothetical protein
MAKISQKIDSLTNSIRNVTSGDSFDTDIIEAKLSELKNLPKGWKFKWEKEPKNATVYKCVIRHSPEVIQGLISFYDDNTHIYMNLIETAPHNYGRNKVYEGVPGNLVAYACKISFEKGYDGYLCFEPKTKLVDHYKESLRARSISQTRMIIDTASAIYLVDKYFNK